jgi:hypothetical protein
VSDVPDDWLASLHFSAARLAQPPKSINSPLHHLGEAAISCEMLTTRQASEDDGTFLEEVFLQAMRVQHSGFCGTGPKVVSPVADTTRRVESCISLCSRAVVSDDLRFRDRDDGRPNGSVSKGSSCGCRRSPHAIRSSQELRSSIHATGIADGIFACSCGQHGCHLAWANRLGPGLRRHFP